MAAILVVGEQAHGHLKKATLSALTAAQQMAQKSGAQIQAVLVGSGIGPSAQELASYGFPVHAVDAAPFEHALAETHSAAIAAAAKAAGATDVVMAATAYGKDVAPRVAVKLGAAVASDVLAIAGDGGKVLFQRAMWAGNATATVEVAAQVRVVTVRATEFAAAQKASSAGQVQPLSVQAPQAKTKFLEFNEVKSARPELTEARVVVSGGRGTKGDFKPIEQLADALGAAVGASRAVVDAGWQPNDLQVGQTGKVVAPQLYIAAGISGAIQHLAGMKGSKTIVAINKDAEAPIFQVADYGLVGDLFKALPELADAVKKLQ
ncbi:MAG: electron transfer flavoprotein subunit alpha/FixB family protein [Myxococcales bacterium]